MDSKSFVFLGVTLAASVSFVPSAHAQLGNLTYEEAEIGLPISQFDRELFGPDDANGSNPAGSNTAAMLRGVLFVASSKDSGAGGAGLHAFDVTNPRAPRRIGGLTGESVNAHLRELHAMPIAIIEGKDFLALPTTTGIQIFDVTNPAAPLVAGSLELPGVAGGDYDNAAWQLSWGWPYLYVGATGAGVYAVNASDPYQPTLVSQMTIGQLGAFRVGPIHAVGNQVIVSGMDQSPTLYALLDYTDPASPFLVANTSVPSSMYSTLVVGDLIIGTGGNGGFSVVRWTPDGFGEQALTSFGWDKGGYCTFQAPHAFCGQSSQGYAQVDLTTPLQPVEVGRGDHPELPDADNDFATVLGNLVYLGDDHGAGSALIPHATAPDTTAPEVIAVYPSPSEEGLSEDTRLTVFLSEEVSLDSLTSDNVVLLDWFGNEIPLVLGRSSFNAVSIGPQEKLQPGTEYSLGIRQLQDLSGNVQAAEKIVSFSIQGEPVSKPETQVAAPDPFQEESGEEESSNQADEASSDGDQSSPRTGCSVSSVPLKGSALWFLSMLGLGAFARWRRSRSEK